MCISFHIFLNHFNFFFLASAHWSCNTSVRKEMILSMYQLYFCLTCLSHRCQAANKTCPTDYIWNNHFCRCLAQQDFIFSSNAGDGKPNGVLKTKCQGSLFWLTNTIILKSHVQYSFSCFDLSHCNTGHFLLHTGIVLNFFLKEPACLCAQPFNEPHEKE